MAQDKPFGISKWAVHSAWTKVRANQGAAGVDGVTIKGFEKKLENNLYRIWNRMSSGSYMPPAVRRVMIPKTDGGQRPLGIPTVGDRVAQMVVKLELEPKVEPLFHPDSYGYRPNKSALDAVGVCRTRCWRYDWAIDLDIRGFFDQIDHSLMMHAVGRHTDSPWMLLYIERWLKAPVKAEDGTLLARDRGTPQGGVISPLLANIFLHHVFDQWISREYPGCPFERYADDVVIHCSSREQALAVKSAVEARLLACKLEAHPDKTRIVCCQDGDRHSGGGAEGGASARPHGPEVIGFDFLGYGFGLRRAKTRRGDVFTSFLPGISAKATKAIAARVREWNLHRRSDAELEDLSRDFDPKIRGWIAYYGRFYRTALRRPMGLLNDRLVRWAQKKYKRFQHHQTQARQWLRQIARAHPALFGHWSAGITP
jgi:RNA-directed DNA polymerase